jgi:transcriptional regulator with XRE-family HTH domain
MEFKSNLKFWREDRHMTQKELAAKAGVSIRMIQHYEQGQKDINNATVLTVLRLSEALGCDVYDIINPRSDYRGTRAE